MFAASVGKKQINKTLLVIVAAIIVVFAVIFIIGKNKGTGSAETIPGTTPEQRETYLLSLGIQVDSTSSMAEVGVPKEFDERFVTYNNMLMTTGFDLTPLKGERVHKCVYTVTNRQDLGASISAVLLIHKDVIVGGHLIDNATGAVYPLYESGADDTQQQDATQETILPAEVPPTAEELPAEDAAAFPQD